MTELQRVDSSSHAPYPKDLIDREISNMKKIMRFEEITYVGTAYGKKIYVLLCSEYDRKRDSFLNNMRPLVNYCFNDFTFSNKENGIERIGLDSKCTNCLHISEGGYKNMLKWAEWESRSLDGICGEMENSYEI